MQFNLIGFSQDTGFRVFAFEGAAAGRIRTEYTVRADLDLIRNMASACRNSPVRYHRNEGASYPSFHSVPAGFGAPFRSSNPRFTAR